jgi:hypothetical protein
MRCPHLIATVLVALLADTAASGQSDDPIARSLGSSKEEYRDAARKAKADLLDAIDTKALNLGKNTRTSNEALAAQLEEIRRGRKAFEEEGYLPDWPILQKAVKAYKAALRKAEERCSGAYDRAIDAYRKKHAIATVSSLVEEKKKFFPTLPAAVVQSPADLGQFAIVRGDWKIRGGELIQSSTTIAGPVIFFGSPEWSDYDAQLDVNRSAGHDAASLLVRAANQDHSLTFLSGANSGREAHIHSNHFTATKIVAREDFPLPDQKLVTLKIRARGDAFEGKVLDGDRVLSTLDWKAGDYERGMVGLGTWYSAYQFRNILVSSPDGKVLWKGLPAVPD